MTSNQLDSYEVVIAAFNAESTIRAAISSVRHQTLPPSRVLVVDDGSTDKTAEIIAPLADRVLRCPVRSGAAAARNLGLDAVESPWLLFLDADDELLPDAGEVLLRAAATSELGNLVAVSGRAELFGTDEQDQELLRSPALTGSGRTVTIRELWNRNVMTSSATLLATEAARRLRYRAELTAVEDYDFFLRAALEGGQLLLLDQLLARRQWSRHSVTGAVSRTTEMEARVLTAAYRAHERTRLLPDVHLQSRLALTWLRGCIRARQYQAEPPDARIFVKNAPAARLLNRLSESKPAEIVLGCWIYRVKVQ